MIHSVNAGWQRTAHSACERPSTQLRDRCLLDVDGGLKGWLLEAVEQITLLHIRTIHEELLLQENSDAPQMLTCSSRLRRA
jgi:hypothetical protein